MNVGDDGGHARVIIEKPFGHDLASAVQLNDAVAHVFNEDQIFRIDHYLGKETVQNIFVFRFAQALFEPLWNSQYIDNVQITAAESIGIEGRGPFYEKAGASRDILQNHMMEMLAYVAMDRPRTASAEDVIDRASGYMGSDPERRWFSSSVEGWRGPPACWAQWN